MKVFLVVIVASFWAVSSSPVSSVEEANFQNSIGKRSVEDEDAELVSFSAAASDVLYYFFNQNDTLVGTEIQSSNVEALGNTEFNPGRNTVVLIHGWDEDNTHEVNRVLTSAFLGSHDVNVFVVDWGALAITDYVSARSAVNPVGTLVGNFIQVLVNLYGLNLSTVTLVGFSLGAHVAGAAGATLGGSVGLIVGLDPAGPLFSVLNTDQRLDASDAQFVQGIHTSASFGFSLPLGNSDYYPNGGANQPGCNLNITFCPHERAYLYYGESVSASVNRFVSLQCSNYASYSLGALGGCRGNHKSLMGGYPVDKT